MLGIFSLEEAVYVILLIVISISVENPKAVYWEVMVSDFSIPSQHVF